MAFLYEILIFMAKKAVQWNEDKKIVNRRKELLLLSHYQSYQYSESQPSFVFMQLNYHFAHRAAEEKES